MIEKQLRFIKFHFLLALAMSSSGDKEMFLSFFNWEVIDFLHSYLAKEGDWYAIAILDVIAF